MEEAVIAWLGILRFRMPSACLQGPKIENTSAKFKFTLHGRQRKAYTPIAFPSLPIFLLAIHFIGQFDVALRLGRFLGRTALREFFEG